MLLLFRRGPVIAAAATAIMEFLFEEPTSPLLVSGFLGPFDFLKLAHVSKRARNAAIPRLQALEADPETSLHANRFKTWLTTSPIDVRNLRGTGFHEERTELDDANLAGPLRLETIENMSSILVQNFVVLKCKKMGYKREHCEVAVFNDVGKFVAYYVFRSDQFYTPAH